MCGILERQSLGSFEGVPGNPAEKTRKHIETNRSVQHKWRCFFYWVFLTSKTVFC
jgi:hypothetical protein